MTKRIREAPTPLRIPKDWEPEIEKARERRAKKLDKPVSKHSWLLAAIRRVLDGEQPSTVQTDDEPTNVTVEDQPKSAFSLARDEVSTIPKKNS